MPSLSGARSGRGHRGLGSEDGHSDFTVLYLTRKSKGFPYVQEVGNLLQNAPISTLLDKAAVIWYTKVVNYRPTHRMEVTDAHKTDFRRTAQGPAD